MRTPAAARLGLAAASLGLTVLASSIANAGTPSPLSTIHTLPQLSPLRATTPVAVTVPGVTLKTRDGYNGTKWHDLTTATGRGYCFASTDGGFRFMNTMGMSSKSDRDEVDLDRLFEKDGKTMFERTRVALDGTTATVTAVGRATVELQEIGRGPEGLVVWAYRTGPDVIVLTKRADRGMESFQRQSDDGMQVPFVSVDGCPYAGARLDAKKPEAGTFAQLVGTLPAKGTGKEKVEQKFFVDASLSKVARDPEPMISVRIRVRD